MVDAVRLWFVFAGASIRSQMQYRVSFLVAVFGQFFATVIEFFAVWTLFDRFGGLGDWTLPEVAVFYGVAHVSMALADLVSSGWDYAGDLIRGGRLDRILLRPRTTILQLLGHEFQLRRLGRLTQGALVLGWGIVSLGTAWTWTSWVAIALAMVGGACLFLALFVLRGTMAIWTVQSLEIVNATTYGGVQAAQYPMSIYEAWFRRFFTYLIPLMAVSYYPVVTALGKVDPTGAPSVIGWLSWVAGPVLLAVAFFAWTRGVRFYTSTGS